MAEKKAQANTGLNQLEIEQLEELLCVSLDNQEDSDTDRILDLLQMIEDRKNQSQSVPDLDVDKAWETFQSAYASEDVLYPVETAHQAIEKQPRKKRLSLRRVWIGVAVAACLLAFAIPTALGTEIFQKMFGTWTEQEFQFKTDDDVCDKDENSAIKWKQIPDGEEYTGYQNLSEALLDYGIEELLVPGWFPKTGVYEQVEMSVIQWKELGKVEFYAVYKNDDQILGLSYILREEAEESSATYEKDDRPVEIYISGGVRHYIFHNNAQVIATWYRNNIECMIFSNCSMDDMELIIDSIYER